MIEYVWVRIGGGPEVVQQLLDGLPGDHQAEQVPGVDRYCVASTDAGFLRFAIANQGYGEILDEADTREGSMSRHPTALDPVLYPPDEPAPMTPEEFAAGVRAALLADVLDEDERHDLMGRDLYDPQARAEWDDGR